MTIELKSAVVIDDSLGPPALGSIDPADKSIWIDHILNSDKAESDIRAILNPTNVELDTDTLLASATSQYSLIVQLWDAHKRNEYPDANLTLLFGKAELDLKGKASSPNQVIDTLSQICGADNVSIFSDIKSGLSALANTDIAFLDFYLSDGEEDRDAFQRIKENAETLKQVKLLFIMSSRASLEQQQLVREIIGTRTAFFDVIRKNDISPEFLARKISLKSSFYTPNKNIEELIDSLITSATSAIEEFTTQCKALEIHDLSLLNLTRLNAEGESIQEYLNWLFSEAIAAKTRRNAIPRLIENSNNIGFSGQIQQGRVFFDLFAEIVFGPAVNSDSTVRFGELLIETATGNYLLVLTPACDLQRCTLNHPVLCVYAQSTTFANYKELAENKLYGKFDSSVRHLYCPKTASKTEYIMLDWQTASIVSHEVQHLQDVSKFTRIALMNEIFAQELKEEVLRNLGRVGTQIDPPPPITLSAKVRWKNLDSSKREEYTPANSFISALMTYAEVKDDENKPPKKCLAIVLSDEFKYWILNKISIGLDLTTHSQLKRCLDLIEQTPKFIFKNTNNLSYSSDQLRIKVLKEEEVVEMTDGILEIILILPVMD